MLSWHSGSESVPANTRRTLPIMQGMEGRMATKVFKKYLPNPVKPIEEKLKTTT